LRLAVAKFRGQRPRIRFLARENPRLGERAFHRARLSQTCREDEPVLTAFVRSKNVRQTFFDVTRRIARSEQRRKIFELPMSAKIRI
jgi:hypothetical protein